MNRVETLIDNATIVLGSKTALARHLGITTQRLWHYRNGTRDMPTATLAELAEIMQLPGEEARELLALVELERPKNRDVKEVLRRAFFGSSVAGALATVLLLGANDAKASNECRAQQLDDLYIVVCARRWFVRALAAMRRSGLRPPVHVLFPAHRFGLEWV